MVSIRPKATMMPSIEISGFILVKYPAMLGEHPRPGAPPGDDRV
jgi:hypothetical protein